MAAVSLWLVGALVLPLLLWLWVRGAPARARLARCGEQIPGPRPLPLIGNLLDVGFDTKKVQEVIVRFCATYGPLFRVWMGPGILFVNLVDPRDIEALLSKNKNLKKAFNYEFLHPWLGMGLLTSTGERWKKHRRIITPTFHFSILEQFVDIFDKQGNIFLSILKKQVGEGPFDIGPLVDLYTQDVISESAMGVQLNSQTEGYATSYLQSVKSMCELLILRSAKPWLYPEFIYRFSPLGRMEKKNLEVLHGLTNEVIRRRRKYFEENPSMFETNLDDLGRKKKLAFLDLLLYYTRDGSLSDEDIREEVDTFMFEGHDTTASGISFALMELARRPEIQKKIVDELKQVSDGSGDLSLSLENLNNLKYLEQVIKETLRMYPSVPAIGRQLTEDFELASRPVVIPPGVTVTVITAALHRNPEVYANPDEFNPDNFSPELVSKRHPYTYVPFSAGPRNCIGQKFAMLEMKCILAKIIWNYSLEIDPAFELEMLPEITLKSKYGVRLCVETRVRDNVDI